MQNCCCLTLRMARSVFCWSRFGRGVDSYVPLMPPPSIKPTLLVIRCSNHVTPNALISHIRTTPLYMAPDIAISVGRSKARQWCPSWKRNHHVWRHVQIFITAFLSRSVSQRTNDLSMFESNTFLVGFIIFVLLYTVLSLSFPSHNFVSTLN